MMEQLGKEPIEEEIPPDWEDLPEIVVQAVSTFNMLGDRAYPEIGYVGKDYTNLTHYLELYGIDDKEYFLELDTYKQYKIWADNEPQDNCSDICKSCKYYGNCLTEHYRYVKDLDNGCNGYKGLLDYARMESKI